MSLGLALKMPTTSSGHTLVPSRLVHSSDFSGMRSPTFKLKRAAMLEGTITPERVRLSASSAAGGMVTSVLVAAKLSGSTAKPRTLTAADDR